VFDAVELGRKVGKKDFARREEEIRIALLAAQQKAREAHVPVVVLISGVEGAGKGDVVQRLASWCDARGVRTEVFWDETDEERQRPRWWRFWRALPPRGAIGVLFGSWYTKPIVDRALDRDTSAAFDRELDRIAAFERMLVEDGALVVKLWFHIPRSVQKERFEEEEKATPGRWSSDETASYGKHYDRFAEVSAAALQRTHQELAPWHVIEATDPRYRDLTAGERLEAAITARLSTPPTPAPPAAASRPGPTVLDAVDLTRSVSKDDYEHEAEKLQKKLARLTWAAYRARRSTALVFEGWDAAGKGGAIRRLVDPIDPRLVRVIPIAAPTDEERAQHYLWRFWRQIPRDGRIVVYDRSWYGRVLVERVEGFAKPDEWGRAYAEINEFERQLDEHGAAVLKFWLHIDRDEQARRFSERENTPYKAHKIGPEDWRNRARWDDYAVAVQEMVERTHRPEAPWILVPANDKRHARLTVLRAVADRLERLVDG
jgi:polyphosphate:AMP phosphotransferase